MITIGEGYRLTADKDQYILKIGRPSKRKDTGEIYTTWEDSYFPRIQHVANAIMNAEMFGSLSLCTKNDLSALDDVADLLEDSCLKLCSAIEGQLK